MKRPTLPAFLSMLVRNGIYYTSSLALSLSLALSFFLSLSISGPESISFICWIPMSYRYCWRNFFLFPTCFFFFYECRHVKVNSCSRFFFFSILCGSRHAFIFPIFHPCLVRCFYSIRFFNFAGVVRCVCEFVWVTVRVCVCLPFFLSAFFFFCDSCVDWACSASAAAAGKPVVQELEELVRSTFFFLTLTLVFFFFFFCNSCADWAIWRPASG